MPPKYLVTTIAVFDDILLTQDVQNRLSRSAGRLSVVAETSYIAKLVANVRITVVRCVGIFLPHGLDKFICFVGVEFTLYGGNENRAFNLDSHFKLSVDVAISFHSTLTL